MTTAYSQAPMSHFGGSPWDRAVPAHNDDSDQSYNIPREQFRSLKSHTNSDYYHTGYDSKRSSSGRGSLSSDSGRKRSIGSGMNQQMVDDSAWIHRDKLAQIETQEMQEAGLRVRRPSSPSARSRSRSATRSASRNSDRRGRDSRHTSRSQSDAGQPVNTFHSYDDMHDLTVPPMPVESESYSRHNSGLLETNGFGFEDAPEQSPRIRSPSRPGTSRIPVSRNSPAPLSNAVLERDSPLNRSRNGSLALSASPEMTQKPKRQRPRSQSLGSQMMLEEQRGLAISDIPRSRPVSMHLANSPMLNNDSSAASSPKFTKSPKPAPLNPKKGYGRNATNATKGRVTSTSSNRDSPSSRPRSSHNRPRSVHRPEGEAPWIATMYKPDPMLPPDQQILPTHAKKLMQERWAAEGATGDTYDKDFNLLNSRDIAPPKPKLKKQVSFDGSQPHIIPDKQVEDDGERFPTAWQPGSEAHHGEGGYRSAAPGDMSPAPSPGPGESRAGKGNRQSVYRLQTVGALPRENQVREDAKGVAELDSHGGLPQLQPVHHAAAAGGEDDDDHGKKDDENKIVHRIDLEGLRRQKREEREREKEAGCCKCVVM